MENRQSDSADRFPIPQEKTTLDPVAVQGEIAGLQFLCVMLFGLAFRQASAEERTAMTNMIQGAMTRAKGGRTTRFTEGFSQVLEEVTHAIQRV